LSGCYCHFCIHASLNIDNDPAGALKLKEVKGRYVSILFIVTLPKKKKKRNVENIEETKSILRC
jgi:hypothetical protein